MKKYLIALGAAWVLCACTSEESKVKAAFLDTAKERFQTELKEEFSKGMTGKTTLQGTAVKVLTDRSEFEVQKVEVHGDTASGIVQILTVPPKNREALIEIMAKLDESKQKNFNVNNALQLIGQQLQTTDTKALLVYKLQAQKSGDTWKVQ